MSRFPLLSKTTIWSPFWKEKRIAGQARKEFEATGNRLLENSNRISGWELAVRQQPPSKKHFVAGTEGALKT